MKIFIFKPAKCWSYCGGGRVVIAESLEAVNEMFPGEAFDGKPIKYFSELSGKEEDQTDEIWELVEEMPTKEMTRRIVLDDYNWA